MIKIKSLLMAMILCAAMNGGAQAMGFSGFILPARYYDAAQGRFISPDPIVPSAMDPQSLDRYAYVRNNPMVLTDPSGYSWLSDEVDKVNHWADHNPVGSIVIAAACPAVGVPLMDRTNTGRDVLAGAIVAGTTIGTAGIGGSVWWGAVSGELIGGYSAYQSDGSILGGVAVGGAVGASTGYLGSRAGYMYSKPITGTYSDATGLVIKNAISMNQVTAQTVGHVFAQGFIRGAGMGAIDAYAGGRGSMSDISRSALRGGLNGGVTNTLTYVAAVKYGHIYATQPLTINVNFDANAQKGVGAGAALVTLSDTAAFGPFHVVDQNFSAIAAGEYQPGMGEFEFSYGSNVDAGLGPILGGFFH